MDCSRDLTKSIPLKRAPVIFHWSLMCSVQGGKCTLESRASTEVYYPIHVTKVLAIQATGTAHSNGQTNYGLGLVASNANSTGFTLLNCSEEAPRYYKEASWIVIGI